MYRLSDNFELRNKKQGFVSLLLIRTGCDVTGLSTGECSSGYFNAADCQRQPSFPTRSKQLPEVKASFLNDHSTKDCKCVFEGWPDQRRPTETSSAAGAIKYTPVKGKVHTDQRRM